MNKTSSLCSMVAPFAAHTIVVAACAGSPAGSSLALIVHEPPNHQERLVASHPDSAVIDRTVRTLSWSDITFVVLRTDENNWIEGSGSLNDGLSARYARDGEEHVAARPPASLDEVLGLLQSYRRGDGRWLRLIEWQ